jgi:hypothetical protein
VTPPLSSRLTFYFPNDETEMYSITKSLQNMNRMMKNEFSEGLAIGKVDEILPDILSLKWNSDSEWIPVSGYFDHLDLYQAPEAPIPNKEYLNLVKELFTTPKIEVRDNHWIVSRAVANSLNGVSFRKFSGTLKPLMITEYNETVLLADDSSKVARHWSEYWTDDILQEAIKKKNNLLSKLSAEWKSAIQSEK